MKIIAIAAIDENNGIGYEGDLLTHIPEDMRRFKDLTTGHTVVMGYRTYESVHLLPNRNNIIVHRGESVVCDGRIPHAFLSMEDTIKFLELPSDEPVYVMGGAFIYAQLLPYCDTLEITHIYHKFENVDTYFPQIDSEEWEITAESELKTYGDLSYKFVTYERRKT